MCRLIIRSFSDCKHEKKYLARCANPDPRACCKPRSLPWIRESYLTACPDCQPGKSVHPKETPYQTLEPPTDDEFENHPDAQAAASAYARSLCSFLSSMFNNVKVSEDTAIQRFAVASCETVCQISPQHSDSNEPIFCECDESNFHPELRNLSQGLRFHVVHDLLTAPDDEICLGHITAGPPPNLALCRVAAVPFFSALRDELSLYSSPELRHAQVLTRWLPYEGTSHSHFMDQLQQLEGIIALATMTLGGEEGWIQTYLDARNLDHNDDSHFIEAETSYSQRQRVLSIQATLLAADDGLTLGRMTSCLRLLLGMLDPRPLDPGEYPLGEDFASLVQGTTWNMARDDQYPRESMGALFSNPAALSSLVYQLAERRDRVISLDISRTLAAMEG